MNVERLRAIATAVSADFQATNIVALVQALRDALQRQITQPSQPGHQQQVSQSLVQLRAASEKSIVNGFSPAWHQVLADLGVAGIVGSALADSVNEVFARNAITPAIAHQELAKLAGRIERVSSSFAKLLEALDILGVEADELDPGAAEVGVLVPRDFVKNQLADFGVELQTLGKTLNVFSELALGKRDGFTIRSVSSSDLSIFLNIDPKVAACLAVAVERIIALYKQLLEIRRLRKELRAQSISDEELKGIDSHAAKHMKEGIEHLLDELIKEYGKEREKARRNELKNELRAALNRIANRVDKGFNIEIRVAEPAASEQNGVEEEDAKQLKVAVETINSKSLGLRFIKPGGDPILALPEPADDAE
jgi:hypothetical protein